MSIQVDMFEVQLGSAMLLQFKPTESNWVRVLADAGINASGYTIGHVHNKLGEALKLDEAQPKRIDLIIGTHYDKDHLNGLVPVIEDTGIEIGEAWLPPVADDMKTYSYEDSIEDEDILAHQFYQEDGEGRLQDYLKKKAMFCQEIKTFEDAAKEYHFFAENNEGQSSDDMANVDCMYDLESFERHLIEANQTLDDSTYEHTKDIVFDGVLMNKSDYWDSYALDFLKLRKKRPYSSHFKYYNKRWYLRADLAHIDALNFALIRRSAAKDAINAIYLEKVVRALKDRNIPIVCNAISNGSPRKFVWSESDKRFVMGVPNSENITLTLLGPSQGLVQKHAKRLPIGEYVSKAMLALIPIKSITPSNQLSYVIKFSFCQQNILITGDAGFVDFRDGQKRSYHQKLVKELGDLDLIQVAHHAGNNAHFYRVLLQAKYAKQNRGSFLLLSHAVKDEKRPSEEFSSFIQQLISDEQDVELLFTSRPSLEKVKDFLSFIHSRKGYQQALDVGDVRLELGDDRLWKVTKHAIEVKNQND